MKRVQPVLIALLMALLLLGLKQTAPVQATENARPLQSWAAETVDSTRFSGKYNSLALDSSGHPHIAYRAGDSTLTLKHAWYNGSSWQFETIDSGQVIYETATQIDSNNRIHVIFMSQSSGVAYLKYAYHNGSSWSVETIDSSNLSVVSGFIDLAVDSSNRPHVAYYAYDHGELRYAYHNGSSWQIQELAGQATDDAIGLYPSIALDSNNRPHISYYIDSVSPGLESAEDLGYIYYNGSSWVQSTVATSGDVGQYSAIALDSSNRPHIAYRDNTHSLNRLVKYSYYNGSSWQTETVETFTAVDIALSLDGSNHPHLAYINGDLKYAYHDGSSWTVSTQDISPGGYTDLALNSSNEPHISYEGSSYLKYAAFSTPQLPDLYIQSLTANKTSICVGDSVNFTTVVKNQGSGDAGSSNLYYYEGTSSADYSSYVSWDDVTSLTAGSSSGNEDYTHIFNTAGTRYFNVWADATTIISESNENNNKSYRSISVAADTTKPTGSISINSGATYATSTGVTLNLSASDSGTCAGSVSQMRFSNGSTWGSWQSYSTSRSYTLPNGDGLKTVYVQFKDSNGQISSSTSDSITLDTTGPSAPTLVSPTYGSSTTDNTPYLDWYSLSGISQYQVQIDNNPDFSSPVQHVYRNSSYSYYYASALSDGLYYWRVRAQDTAGNWGSWSSIWNFTVDTVDPSSSVTAPSGTTASTSFTVYWSGSDSGSGVKDYDVQYQVNSGTWSNWKSNSIATSATFSGATNGSTYCFRSRAEDNAGNLESYPTSADTCVTVDTSVTQPDLTVNIATSSSSICLGQSVDIYATEYNQGGDDAEGHYLYYYDDSSNSGYNNYLGYRYLSSLNAGSSSLKSFSFIPTTVGLRYLKAYADGSNIITEQSENNNGGWINITVKEDTTAPTGSISINNGATYAASTSVALSLSASDSGTCAGSVSQMRFSNNGSTWGSWQSYSTSRSYTLPGGDGAKTVYVQFKDSNGQISNSISDSITLDTTGPSAPTLVLPTSGSSTNDNTPYLNWNSVSGVSQYQVQIDDSSSFFSPVKNNAYTSGSYYYAPSLSDGLYYWRVRTQDAVGNWGSWSSIWNFTVDTLDPSSSVTAPSGTTTSASFTVQWSGSDNGSGLKDYDVQYQVNSGTWSNWQNNTAATSATFSGATNGTYCFRSRAEDNAGNVESYPASADTCVTVDTGTGVSQPDLTVSSLSLSSSSICLGESVTIYATEKNQGNATAGFNYVYYYNDTTTAGFSNYIGWDSVDALNNGATINLNHVFTPSLIGTHYVKARADADGFISESDENNNGHYTTLTVNQDTTAPTGSVTINGGDDQTTSTDVILTINTSDSGPCAGSVSQMRFSHNNGSNWSSWENYAASKSYTLPDGDGIKTIAVQFKDSNDQISDSYKDSITLDTTSDNSYVYIPIVIK